MTNKGGGATVVSNFISKTFKKSSPLQILENTFKQFLRNVDTNEQKLIDRSVYILFGQEQS